MKAMTRARTFLFIGFLGWNLVGASELPPNTVAQQNSEKWESEIAAFEAGDRTNPPPRDCILFVGSSSIRMWSTLRHDFPGLPVVNRGFGGSQIADSNGWRASQKPICTPSAAPIAKASTLRSPAEHAGRASDAGRPSDAGHGATTACCRMNEQPTVSSAALQQASGKHPRCDHSNAPLARGVKNRARRPLHR